MSTITKRVALVTDLLIALSITLRPMICEWYGRHAAVSMTIKERQLAQHRLLSRVVTRLDSVGHIHSFFAAVDSAAWKVADVSFWIPV